MKSVVVEMVLVVPDDYDSSNIVEIINETMAMCDVFIDKSARIVTEGAIDAVG